MMRGRIIYLLLLLSLLCVCVPQYANAKKVKIVNRAVSVKCGQEKTIEAANMKNKIKWSSTSKKIKIVKKYGRNNGRVKIKGVKEGTAVLKAVSDTKTIKFRIKVVKDNKDDTSSSEDDATVNITLKNLEVKENYVKLDVSITNSLESGIRMGANAEFYRWDDVSSVWALVENSAPFPEIICGAPKGIELGMRYTCIPTTGNIVGGKYKIVLDDIYAADSDSIVMRRPEIEFSV